MNGSTTLLQQININNQKLEELSKYLTELESQLSLVYSAIPDMVIITNKSGDILNVNNAVKTILGYTPIEIKQKNIYEFVHPEDLKKTDAVFNKILSTGENIKVLKDTFFINRWLNKTGEYSKLAWRYGTYDNKEDCVIGFATALGDLNEFSPFAFHLAKKSLDAAKDGVVITDNTIYDNIIIYVNEAFCKNCGYSKEELVGQNCRILQSKDIEQAALQTVRNALKEGEGCEVLLRNFKKNGTVFFNHLNIVPVKESGITTNYIVLSKNVTDLINDGYYIWDPQSPRGFGRKQIL